MGERWEIGVWIGKDPMSDEHIIETGGNLLRTSTIRLRAPSESWTEELIKGVSRRVWDIKPEGAKDPAAEVRHDALEHGEIEKKNTS